MLKMKKLSLYFLIASLTWLPIQLTMASSFSVNGVISKAMLNADTSSIEQNNSETSEHCKTKKKVNDCCSNGGACAQMDDCNHCVSFVAMPQTQISTFLTSMYSPQQPFVHLMIGSIRHSEYRPPRFV